MTELIERKKITIVGAGYVGMSIAVALAVKEDVLILESNKEKIDRLNSGKPSINDSDINVFCHDQSFPLKPQIIKKRHIMKQTSLSFVFPQTLMKKALLSILLFLKMFSMMQLQIIVMHWS